MDERRMHLWKRLGHMKALFLLLAVAALLYGSSLDNAFVLDDENQVVNNPPVHSIHHLADYFTGSTFGQFTGSLTGIYFKPLMMISYSLLWSIAPDDPLPFHIFQLLLAVLNAFLLLLFLREIVSETAAWGAALLFLVHPINSETVLYIADLQDVLYTLFGLLALRLLQNSGPLGWSRSAGLVGFLLAALFAKETGILYVIVAGVYTFSFERAKLRRTLALLAFVIGAYLAIRLGVARLNSLTYTINQIGRADLATRLLTAPMVLAMYLGKFVFPWRLSITQDWVVESAGATTFWLPLLAVLAVLAASLWWGIRGLRRGRDPRFLFFVFWVFMGLGFHSQIVAALDGTFAERWVYFACVGLVGMLAVAFDQILNLHAGEWLPLRRRPLVMSSFAGLVALLGARTYARSLDWESNYTISLRDLEVEPNSYYIHNNLGVELFRRGQIEAAQREFQRSTELAPSWDVNWNNLGAAYQRLGDLKTAELHYRHSIANGNYYLAYESLATLLVATGREEEARRFLRDSAIPHFPGSDALRSLYQRLSPAP